MPVPLRLRSTLLALALLLVAGMGAPAAGQAATPGLNVDSTAKERLDPALATGAKLIRLFVEWNQLEPSGPGQYPISTDLGATNAAAQYDAAIRRINAAGARPMFVILGTPNWANGGANDNLVPPTDPATYAAFFRRFVQHTSSVGEVAAYEIWNEEDAVEFWHGAVGPAQYGALLRASYAAAKPVAQNGAQILVGPTTGNNATFVQGLYDQGLKGSFDGVAVHTDTACLSLAPDFYYREDPGARVGQYTFLGYRSVRQVMLANGDPDQRIWMTELGWSSTGGGPTSCQRGAGKGVRPSGVSEAQQAALLTQAFACLAHDDYVVAGTWFTFTDADRYSPDEINHYGLLDLRGRQKPAYAAFRAVVDAGGGAPGPCGDFEPPSVAFVTPSNTAYTKSLMLQVKATDVAGSGVKPAGLNRISLSVDGKPAFYRFNSAKDSATVSLDWLRAADLADGPHTVTAEASDRLGNVSKRQITILKGAQYTRNLAYRTKLLLTKGWLPKCRGRTCTVKGRLLGPAGQSLAGRVRVEWQLFVKQRVRSTVKGKQRYLSSYVTFHKGGAGAAKPFSFRQTVKRKGRWRVRVTYDGAPPLKRATVPWRSFRV